MRRRTTKYIFKMLTEIAPHVYNELGLQGDGFLKKIETSISIVNTILKHRLFIETR